MELYSAKEDMEKGFFRIFSPETSAKQLEIPTSFTDYKNGKLPRKVFLRDRFGNMWNIIVSKKESNFYFQYEWEKFIKDNNVEFGDFLIFDYDGKGTFNVKLLGRNECEKKQAGGEKKEEKMNIEHQKNAELKRKNLVSDSSSSSCDDDSDDDSDEDYKVEEEENDDDEEYDVVVEEEEEEKKEGEVTKKASRSKCRYVEEDEEEEEEVEEEEKEEERAGTYKKTVPRSKAGRKRATACKARDGHDQVGADIFKSGRATQPKNPYFVAKIQPNKRYQVHVPINVVRDNKLELPSSMIIRDSAGREFETKLKSWKNGKIWLIGGWRSLFGWNLVRNNDKCICEFVRGKGNEGLYLQVQVLHEGASSRPNKKNKK